MRALAWLFAGVLMVGAAAAQEYGDADAGRDFARDLCARCHAVEPEGMISPHADAPTFRRIASVPGMTSTALFVVLRTPHRQMPDLVLSADEIRNVAAYILSLEDTE